MSRSIPSPIVASLRPSLRPSLLPLLLLASLLAACDSPSPAPTPISAPVAKVTLARTSTGVVFALADDGLPAAKVERGLLFGKCQICHAPDYVKQQRLTPAQWTATVQKMKAWGAPLEGEEAELLARVLAASYPADLADLTPARVATPEGGTSTAR
ncbi:MAG: hypothetical protein IT384_32275 [Deltaproteobacteria bacterium]|nr:hypothetical protein [Deltaproteobacteria bacterium]